jgi:hypothetical protein
MTEYMRLRSLARWEQEQLEVVALLNRWSSTRWALARTTDGVGQIVRTATYDYPIGSRRS